MKQFPAASRFCLTESPDHEAPLEADRVGGQRITTRQVSTENRFDETVVIPARGQSEMCVQISDRMLRWSVRDAT